ncbi:ABC transporter [Streptomyces beijiangensis]|uniref:ABC transporter n=1 Tax=Streptomyces beijiangensis TaxID=163361 RepID=A0A939FAI0_9ACTN|nr:ABC transporter [Streptomyces beijiangensis]MBO0514523.1 ABC transporter [Streptomyces beijiangensis]
MTALLRYQTALLLRSQRWLPPVLLYGIFLAAGAQGGDPVLDSLGVAAAALLPVTAWLVRICATQEPPAARHCTAAATSPARVHLSCLGAASGCAAVLAVAGTAVITAMSDATSTDHQIAVPRLPAATAGLLAALVCALVGAALGALLTWPVLRSTGWSVTATALASLLALVASGSPAHSAVYGLVTGSQTGTVHLPLLSLTASAAIVAAATAVVCRLASRHG